MNVIYLIEATTSNTAEHGVVNASLPVLLHIQISILGNILPAHPYFSVSFPIILRLQFHRMSTPLPHPPIHFLSPSEMLLFSLTHPLGHLLSTLCVPGTALGIWDISVYKTDTNLSVHERTTLWWFLRSCPLSSSIVLAFLQFCLQPQATLKLSFH